MKEPKVYPGPAFEAPRWTVVETEEVRREYWRYVFAGQALTGLMASRVNGEPVEKYTARARRAADALLEELEVESEGYQRALQYALADLEALLPLGRAAMRYKQARLDGKSVGEAQALLEVEYDALPARVRERLEG